MNQNKILLAIASILILVGIAAIAINLIAPELVTGKTVTEDREVSDFNRISLNGMGNLIIEQNDKESLKIEAGEKIMDKIVTSVKDGELVIEYKQLWWSVFWAMGDINFHLAMKDVSGIKISGSGSARASEIKTSALTLSIEGSGKVNLNVETESLKSTILGSGDFTLLGKADSQELNIEGSGHYQARDLKTKNTAIRISGSGDVVANVEEKLEVNISGSGNVSYLGNPEIKQNISGSGKVQKLE